MEPAKPTEYKAPAGGARQLNRWDNRALFRLIWPLVIGQLLAVSIGMADTVMVTAVGEAAVSGVSIVDAINVLLITMLTALSTGGAVVASQYLGRRDGQNASLAAQNLIVVVLAVSLGLMALALALSRPFLTLVYGHIEPQVMANAQTYFYLSALSYPFIGLYNAGAAIFRSMGNSRVGMLAAFIVNLLNIGGNALLIFGFGMGVAGAALSTLVSRAAAAVILMVLLHRATAGPISVAGLLRTRPNSAMIKRILRIGVPNGLETSTFQIGKLLVARIVTTFGTAAIAGNAIASSLTSICHLPGQAFGLAMLTVVGQCVGAGDYDGAKRNTRKLMLSSWVSMTMLCGVLLIFMQPMLGVFNLSTAGVAQATRCLWVFGAMAPFFWPPSFSLPNALRAAGDARYTMVVSMVSMWTLRVGLSYVLGLWLGLGVVAIWWAMVADWIVRAGCFGWRWLRGRWKNKAVV